MRKVISIFLLTFFLISCSSGPQKNANSFIAQYGIKDPVPHRFKICFSYGCNKSEMVQLSDGQ